MKTFKKKQMNTIRISALAVSLLALAVSFQSCTQTLATAEKKDLAIPAEATKVFRESVALPIHVSGLIRANKESRLSFKTGGIIKKLNVDEGDKVKAGDVLAQLDLNEINQQVLQAKVGLEKAQRDFKRVENLYNDTVTTLEQLQNATSALDVAQATLNIAQYNLKFSTITAPSNGIIMMKFMEENEITGPGIPVFYFASDEDTWKMNVGVSDKNVVKLQMGNQAEIVTDAYPNRNVFASISKIANAPEQTTGLYEVELSLENTGLELKPGFFARGELIPSHEINCYKIPVDAIQEGFGNTVSFFVYENKTGRAVKKESEALFLHNEFVYVNMPLADANLQVITKKQKELKNLDKVQLASLK
ncbi:MAG: efflux RND transporter periplasmic adaptor subunit [Salinivirgaceae bacterium]|jgi:multidrug efflux system membrane fusion protein|nr:efflux RND transporter periplasmic adaptor subunit [Salinivirgaceae bacterium]